MSDFSDYKEEYKSKRVYFKMKKDFFNKYEEHYTECPVFLKAKWDLIKLLIKIKLGMIKEEECCPNDIMTGSIYFTDLESMYGPFIESFPE